MALTPSFFFLGLLFLAWFTAEVHSVKVLPDVLKGSSVVLSPDDAENQIISITWKYGPDLAAEWFGWDQTFYNIFNDTCSLNTETGELTIYNVRPEHSGVYTPYINGKTRSAMKLRVLSPVPKPSITMNCNPEHTKCTLSCWFDRTDDLGDVEVFWILDDSHERGGRKIQITEHTQEETFICILNNSVSFQNSAKLKNLFLPRDTGVPVWIPVVGTLVSLALLVGLIILKKKRHRIKKIIEEIRKTMPSIEHERISAETPAAGSVKDVDLKLLDVDRIILKILREGNKRNLSEDGIWKLLNARYLILWILQQRYEVQESLDNVKEMIEMFFKGRNDLWMYADEVKILKDVDWRIWRILEKRNEFWLHADEDQKLHDARLGIERILKE
ncbi:uncharacterized protein LOC144988876 isoform X2 [Oryzias latipes]